MTGTAAVEYNNEILDRDTDGFYKLENDRKAIDRFLQDDVYPRMKTFADPISRFHYLIQHHYYEDVFRMYSQEEVRRIAEVAEHYHFQFQSYMAVSKFYQQYALKSDDKKYYLENYAQHNTLVALYYAAGDADKAEAYVRALMEQRYQPATPSYLNAGRVRGGELVSCFLLSMDDSLNSINYINATAQQLSKIGGGVAIDLSRLRARGEDIKGIEGVAKGVVPVARELQMDFSYADQLGQRPGAGAAYLNIFHWDMPEFLDTKKENADEDVRLATLSIGLIVPGKFFELARRNKPMNLFAPHSVFKKYAQSLADMEMDIWYDKLSADPDVKKRSVNAREVLNQIAQMQMQSGYPYIFFEDNANRNHPLKRIGKVRMSNLCTEIQQLQETSTITDYGARDEIRRDVSCNLGSLNIVNVMEHQSIKETVRTGMDMLTEVSDQSHLKNAPGVRKANAELHSVGLGAMNLNGYLAKNHIGYESAEARDFVRSFFMAVNFYSIEESMRLARNKGETFKDFDRSSYADGSYFDKYVAQDYLPRTKTVAGLFSGMDLPDQEDWQRLKQQVMKHGLYNAYRLAIAPTQSISYVQNATPSVMPVVDLIERRKYGNAYTLYPMPFLAPDTIWCYKSAYHVNQYRMIDLIAEIQQHIDQGISTILFINSGTSTRQLARLYLYAHLKGLKSLYYTRTKLLNVEECLSCSV
ncbi:class 1b ribonucleoside-diphosphate reductase subunit alpha [Sporolactobacillus vineae]|uniref:class 1b ribonucleoside-diphosphate reductase subunit alpha n=1 Tax=Sporolactobacillus vineae TaxID=444463 RepID=UPI000288F2DB|nr:class 1b ribonucleoside-diphosphate reductase subunit alpha [Sporolactobacillus vineae]